MKYKLFLDTNIYDVANYSFRNAFFTTLKNRALSGEVEIQINSVIEGETKQHINSEIKKAAKELLGVVKKPVFAGFKNITEFGDKLQIPNPSEWVQQAIGEFDHWLSACKVKRISANGINVERIIEDYFSIPPKAPFEPQKKEEFKDAIAVESIICELDNLKEDEIYCLVSNDKGFCRAIEDKTDDYEDKILIFDELKKCIDFLSRMDNMSNAFKQYLDDGGLEDEIISEIQNVVEAASYSIENLEYYCIDDLEVVAVDNIEYETTVIEIDNNMASVLVAAKCLDTIWYKYTDEDESYWDSEEQAYLWQKIVEMQETHNLNFEMAVSLDVSGWFPGVEEKQDVCIEEFFDVPESFELDESSLVEVLDLSEPEYEEEPTGYTICPSCGCGITERNDGGNGFCVRCAPNY